jgi:hypothetical protein
MVEKWYLGWSQWFCLSGDEEKLVTIKKERGIVGYHWLEQEKT